MVDKFWRNFGGMLADKFGGISTTRNSCVQPQAKRSLRLEWIAQCHSFFEFRSNFCQHFRQTFVILDSNTYYAFYKTLAEFGQGFCHKIYPFVRLADGSGEKVGLNRREIARGFEWTKNRQNRSYPESIRTTFLKIRNLGKMNTGIMEH